MPIIKSAKKRMEITAICNAANTSMRTRLKNAVKKFNTAIEANDIEAAEKLLPETIAVIDKSCSYGIIHKNAAARKKAHVSKMLSDAKKAPVQTEATPAAQE